MIQIRAPQIAMVILVALMMLSVPLNISAGSEASNPGGSGAYFSIENGIDVEEFKDIIGDMFYEGIYQSIFDLNSSSAEMLEPEVLKIHSYSTGMMNHVDGLKEDWTIFEEKSTDFKEKVRVILDTDSTISIGGLEIDTKGINGFLGIDHFSAGDILEISGSLSSFISQRFHKEYGEIDITSYILLKSSMEWINIYHIDANVKYLPGGDATNSKEFSISTRTDTTSTTNTENIFDGPLSDVKYGDAYTEKIWHAEDAGEARVDVNYDGKDHSLHVEGKEPEPRSERTATVGKDVSIEGEKPTVNTIVLEDFSFSSKYSGEELRAKLNEVGTFGETYESTHNEFSKQMAKLRPDDAEEKSGLPLIIGGAIVGALVIVGVSIFVIKRRGG